MINTNNKCNVYENSINPNTDYSNFDAYDLPCYHAGNSLSTEAALIEKGIYGAAFKYKNEETLYLRMELITEKTATCWFHFVKMAAYMANDNSRGVLTTLLALAGTTNYPTYQRIKECTGFTENEFITFTKKANHLKELNSKIVKVLAANVTGSQIIVTAPTGAQYIVYVTKNPNFSIPIPEEITKENYTLKNFIDSYNDILICVGSDFSDQEGFHSRGIFRNPHWVFEGKYAGLSMLLHEFTGAVATKFFPEKKFMYVIPVGSMQYIIKQNLLPGDGFIKEEDKKIDITDLEVSPNDPQGQLNYIEISALKRIYDQAVKC